MTHEDWLRIAQPLLELVATGVVALLGALITALFSRARAALDAHGQKAASDVLANAQNALQAAMQNAAGQVLLDIKSGRITWDDVPSRISDLDLAIRRKLPGAIALAKPEVDSITGGIAGKIGNAAPAEQAPVPITVNVPSQPRAPTLDVATTFQARAALVVPRFMKDLDLKRFQSSGLVGNFGHEADGMQVINEYRPVSGRGGYGWGQWTGTRRDDFEDFCKARGFHVTDPEANYQFVVFELLGKEAEALAKLKETKTLEEATAAVEKYYERAGVVAMSSRLNYAEKAMAA